MVDRESGLKSLGESIGPRDHVLIVGMYLGEGRRGEERGGERGGKEGNNKRTSERELEGGREREREREPPFLT